MCPLPRHDTLTSGIDSPDTEPEGPRKLKIYKPPWKVERCSYWIFSDSKAFLNSRTIHGSYHLKEAVEFYALATVLRDAMIERHSTDSTAALQLVLPPTAFLQP
jgi:hypothetical protein